VRGNSETSRIGGVLLYIKEEIKYEIISVESCDKNWWAIVIKIAEVNIRDSIMLIYHSPSGSDGAFIEYLEESCNRTLMSDSFIVMEDFNIDMKVQGYTQDKHRKTMNSAVLSQLVKEATKITSTSETIIDLVFSNMDLQVEVWHERKIMDHSILVLKGNINEVKGGKQRILCRDYKRMDVDTFKRLIELNININEEENINEIASRMVDIIVECIDIVAPEKPIVIKKVAGKAMVLGGYI